MRLWPTKIFLDLKSFVKKGIHIKDSIYGVYVFTGFQGSGKTMNAVEFLLRNAPSGGATKIHTNIDSLNLEHDYVTETGHLNPSWRDCFVVLDEIHKAYPKNSKPDRFFYSFLQESRKHHRVTILITQEWKEVPMWLRRPCKLIVGNHRLFRNFIVEEIQDARTMKWSEEENDYVCDTIQKNVKKWNKCIAECYDTNETIIWSQTSDKLLDAMQRKLYPDNFKNERKGGSKEPLVPRS